MADDLLGPPEINLHIPLIKLHISHILKPPKTFKYFIQKHIIVIRFG